MAGCFDKPTEVFERPFCIHRVSKNWEGRAERRDARVQPCAEHDCRPLKTVTDLRLATVPALCDTPPAHALETLHAPAFFSAFEFIPANRARGVHAADFTWNGHGLSVVGQMVGTINANTARRPVDAVKPGCFVAGLVEGQLCGEVVEDASGQLDRAKLVGNYRFRVTLDPETGIVSTRGVGTFEGVLLQWCKE